MDMKLLQQNAAALEADMQWLAQVIDTRMNLYWKRPCPYKDIRDIMPPDLSADESIYAKSVLHYRFNFNERIIILLALAPHIMPQALDVFFAKNDNYDRGFTEFGGVKAPGNNGFLPTGETATFILASGNLETRFQLLHLFSEEHIFRKFNILKLEHHQPEAPYLSGALSLSVEYLSYFTRGEAHQPDYGPSFPAKRIHTNLEWKDLVLDHTTFDAVGEISDWLKYGDTLLNDYGLRKNLKPGYRTLFYGPPGTGKTLTASLLGKSAALEVYRIDLSMVVSKYIGETEKNLSNVFDQAENKNWILFFDEADALFGKRTQTSSSNDRYANQEVSFLLQRIEDFPGVIILATNLKANLDDAFGRRFQSMIYFGLPDAQQRLQLWQRAFSAKTRMEEGLDLEAIANKYEIAGGAIINVVRYASMKAIKRSDAVILWRDVVAGIRREFAKEGKVV